jgi:mercuric ion transport protein
VRDRTLMTIGAVGAAMAAVCCATSLLAIVLAAVGLTAWVATVDYVLIAVFVLGLALIGWGFCRGRLRAR